MPDEESSPPKPAVVPDPELEQISEDYSSVESIEANRMILREISDRNAKIIEEFIAEGLKVLAEDYRNIRDPLMRRGLLERASNQEENLYFG